jgi:hypothetical protein
MPYAPGIQDISGQLIGEGMTRASNIKAQARSDFGRTIADTLIGGIKQYQQNENFTSQSLAKFTERMQDPEFNKYVNNILADDANKMGVPENVKTAFRNAQTGKLKPNEASTLATIAQDYSERKRASEESDFKRMQTMLAYAQAQGVFAKANAPKPGQIMTQEEFLKLDPALEARGKPIGDGSGRILVESMSNRAQVSPATPVAVSASGGTLVDPKTGATRIIPAIPQADPGSVLEGNVPASPQAAPAASISPDVLAKFAPSSRMAPAAGGLLAQTGPQATPTVSPQTVEAIRAVQPQAAPAGPTPATPSGIRMTTIPGSKAAQEVQAKRQSEVSNYQLQMQNFDTVINAVDKILPNVSARSTGLGSLLKHVPETKANQVSADLTTLLARNAFQGLEEIKNAGGSLGQVAIYEIKLLENARLALNQQGSPKDFADALKSLKKSTQDSKKRLEILARDRKAGLEVPSKEYFKAGGKWPGVSEDMPTVENVQGGATGGGNVVRLNVQRGSTAGSSTLKPSEFDFSAFEGKVLNTPDGKRVRIENGKQVPVVPIQ